MTLCPVTTYETRYTVVDREDPNGQPKQDVIEEIVAVISWIEVPDDTPLAEHVECALDNEIQRILNDPDHADLAASYAENPELYLPEVLALVDRAAVAAEVVQALVPNDAYETQAGASCGCPPAVQESELGLGTPDPALGSTEAYGISRDEMIQALAELECGCVDPDWFHMDAAALLPEYLRVVFPAEMTYEIVPEPGEEIPGAFIPDVVDEDDMVELDNGELQVTSALPVVVASRLDALVASGRVHPATVENLLARAPTDPAAATALYALAMDGVRNGPGTTDIAFTAATGFNDNQQWGGNCATFISAGMMHAGYETFAGWVPPPTQRDRVADEPDYRVFIGGDGLRGAYFFFNSLTNDAIQRPSGAPQGTIVGRVRDDGAQYIEPDFGALSAGDLVFTLFDGVEPPDPDHVSVIVGFGPPASTFDYAAVPQPPIFPTQQEAFAFYADPANAALTQAVFGDTPPTLDDFIPYTADHGGPQWTGQPPETEIPRPYAYSVALRVDDDGTPADNSDRAIVFVDVNQAP